jgi:hypothetical protein
MAYPIKWKIEAVLNGWITKGSLSDISGYTLYKGQAHDRINVPALITAVDSLDPSFADGTPVNAQVTITLLTKADFSSSNTAATAEAAHYAAAAAVADRIGTSGLALYGSVDNIIDRPTNVTGFYIYDIQPPRVSFLYDDERKAFETQLIYTVTAMNSDGT